MDNVVGGLPDAKTERPICGFWRRLIALVLDSIPIFIFGIILGLAFFDFFASIGAWGRLVGFTICLLYFGVLNSSIGGGRTLGKRLMKIRVVNAKGEPLSLGRSCLRTSVLMLPHFVNNLPLSMSVAMSPVGAVLGLLVFGLGGAIIYLYLFNRRTRQSVHDLAVGSFVVRSDVSGPLTVDRVAKIHHILMAVITILSLILVLVVAPRLLKTDLFSSLMGTYDKIQEMPDVRVAGVNVGKTVAPDGNSYTYLVARAVFLHKPQNYERTINEVAQIVLETYPDVNQKNYLSVEVAYGFDIGIASGWSDQTATFTPANWRSMLQMSKPLPRAAPPADAEAANTPVVLSPSKPEPKQVFDAIRLSTGEIVRGRIVEETGTHYTVVERDGFERLVDKTEVIQVERAGGPGEK